MPARRALERIYTVGLIAISGLAVLGLRSRLSAEYAALKVSHDIYPLPSPQRTVELSLGYRSALADLIFAHLRVAYGLHIEQKRPFEFVGNYLDVVNALDPKFEQPYRLTDTLLTLQSKQPPPESFRKARAILERGMREFPFDASLWSSAGQFFAYLGPGGLTDPAERDEWRLAGARAMAHACELVGSDEAVPYHCITAAGLLTNAGQHVAASEFLERVLMVSDDPAIRELAAGALAKSRDSARRDQFQARRQRFERAWATDLPFVTRGAYLAIGPGFDAAACAGKGTSCPTSWRSWGEADSRAFMVENATAN